MVNGGFITAVNGWFMCYQWNLLQALGRITHSAGGLATDTQEVREEGIAPQRSCTDDPETSNHWVVMIIVFFDY